jgi:protein farnesyltransferase subunit beta
VQIFDDQDRIAPLHPVYAIPAECVADIKSYFERKQGF